ncbi:MAG TPA: DinB family protein [Vicinamibacterales bacterium]|jgi:uncharacterized damage-inducible protein DinB
MSYIFLTDAYDTERLKTLSVWSEFSDADLGFRPAGYARTPLEHMVHQCVSEDTWMKTMFGMAGSRPAVPGEETRLAFLRHYADVSRERLHELRTKGVDWWEEVVAFFDVKRPRSWIFLRRLTHSAHHRGQLTVYLRLLGKPLYSTYGPTADTGGLFASGAPTIYRYQSADALLTSEAEGGTWPSLPGPGPRPPTERPEILKPKA